MAKEPRLYPEDQARVDRYLQTGYNDVERKPFRPFRLLLMLLSVVACCSALALLISRLAGVY